MHGILIADDEYDDLYMVPLADVLEDVRVVNESPSVRLPYDTEEIMRLFELQRFKPVTAPSSNLARAEARAKSQTDIKEGFQTHGELLDPDDGGKDVNFPGESPQTATGNQYEQLDPVEELDPQVSSSYFNKLGMEPEFRWQCCSCHADNSGEYNASCYDCSHVKDSSCYIYELPKSRY